MWIVASLKRQCRRQKKPVLQRASYSVKELCLSRQTIVVADVVETIFAPATAIESSVRSSLVNWTGRGTITTLLLYPFSYRVICAGSLVYSIFLHYENRDFHYFLVAASVSIVFGSALLSSTRAFHCNRSALCSNYF